MMTTCFRCLTASDELLLMPNNRQPLCPACALIVTARLKDGEDALVPAEEVCGCHACEEALAGLPADETPSLTRTALL